MKSSYRVTMLGICLAVPTQIGFAQEWGFSSPNGAVVKLSRGADLSLDGAIALPIPGGQRVTVPVTGRNEPGRIFLEFDDPLSGQPNTVAYRREKSGESGYAVWRAEEGPAALRELRALVNVASEPAKSELENWGGDVGALIPVDTFVRMKDANRKFAAKYAMAAESDGTVQADTPIAIVTERPNVAAWEVAAAEAGKPLESLHTFQNGYDGVLFTIENRELVAALSREVELLRDFGGLAKASVPVTSNPNVHSFAVPLGNLFHTYAVEMYNLDKVKAELGALFARMRRWRLHCDYGGPGVAMFSVACEHHTTDHNLSGDFFVSTTFTFTIGELRNNERQIFVMAESFGASAKASSKPRRDRYTYRMYEQDPIKEAHDAAVNILGSALGEMYSGFRRN